MWIKLDDKIPPECDPIIILVNGWRVVCGFRCGKESYYEFAIVDCDRIDPEPIGPGRVAGWMELPNPPKGSMI